jgi:hypothetical protein
MSTGPFLYDDGPAPLHTGTPRRRGGLLLAIFGGTAVVAVLMVLALFLLKGTPEDQAGETAGVFLAALEQGDIETAHGLLCDEERARLRAEDVAAAYLRQGPGELGTPHGDEVADGSILHLPVRWADGSATEWTVVREDGPRVCGTAAAG